MKKYGEDFLSEKWYKIGDYFLLFLGNFTDRKLQFHGKDGLELNSLLPNNLFNS